MTTYKTYFSRKRPVLFFALAATLGCVACSDETLTNSSVARDEPSGSEKSSVTSIGLALLGDTEDRIDTLARRELEVTVAPKGRYTVELALLGDSLDASLSNSSPTTDSEGRAVVTLTASAKPTTFSIRASVNHSLTSELTVTVVDANTNTLRVLGNYSGARRVSNYNIALFSDRDCAVDSRPKSSDSALKSLSTPSLPFVIDNVPLVSRLAVLVEGDRLLTGCEVVDTSAGKRETSTSVALKDLPIQMDGRHLVVAASVGGESPALIADFETIQENLLRSYQDDPSDIRGLLVEMQTAAERQGGSVATEYRNLRASNFWDTEIPEQYAAEGNEDRLRDQFKNLLSPMFARLREPNALILELELEPASYAPVATLAEVAGIVPANCDESSVEPLTLTTEPSDILNFTTKVSFNPQKLVLCELERRARESTQGADATAPALARLFECSTLASRLDAKSSSYPAGAPRTCMKDCLENLCVQAIASMYERAAKSISPGYTATLSLSASGQLDLDADASPTKVTGSWIGQYIFETGERTLTGALSGR